jgi:hypothetical protein
MLKLKNGKAYTERTTKDGHKVWQISEFKGFGSNQARRKPFKAAGTLQLSLTSAGKYILSGTPKIGDKVMFKGSKPDDGIYRLEDDTKVTIVNGVITKVTQGQQQ